MGKIVNNSEWKRRHSAGTSRAMKRRAASTQCPKCGRKNATKGHRFGDGTGVITCRYCDYEKGWDSNKKI